MPWKSSGLTYFLMKCINDFKHTEVYCGVVHLTNDHQTIETQMGTSTLIMWVIGVKIKIV